MNQSFFAKKWYVYDDEDNLEYLVDNPHGCDLGWCLESNIPFSPNKYIPTELFMLFIECILNSTKAAQNESEYEYDEKLASFAPKIEQYVKSTELKKYYDSENNTNFDVGFSYDEKFNTKVLVHDWHWFLHYHADDNAKCWLINTNPESNLFEYVIYCGHECNYELFHFSEMAKYEHLIYDCIDEDSDDGDDDE